MVNIIFCLLLLQQPAHLNIDRNKLALDGYDPVSYFADGGPQEGKGQFEATVSGVKYRFASQQNLSTFTANPGKYTPEYGGWCAYAMGATGDKVKVDPETFKIVDGKLYLFYNFWGNNTLEDWNDDEPNLMDKANQYWEMIVKS